MKLTVLGKYGPYPKEKGACSSYLLEAANKKMIVDCGNGCLSRLQQFISIPEIDAIFISHLHHDHISDLFILRYAIEGLKARGVTLQLPVPLYMPDEPRTIADLIKGASVFNVQTIRDEKTIQVEGVKVTFKKMTHPVVSYAMRFEADGKAFVYSGDTNMNENIIPFAGNADLLLMEAGLLTRDKKDHTAPHVSVKEAGQIGREAGVLRLLATHLYPLYQEDEILTELKEQFKNGEIAQENRTYDI